MQSVMPLSTSIVKEDRGKKKQKNKKITEDNCRHFVLEITCQLHGIFVPKPSCLTFFKNFFEKSLAVSHGADIFISF